MLDYHLMTEIQGTRSRKRVFIGLICFALALLFGVLVFSWHLFFKSNGVYQKFIIFAIIAGFCLMLIAMGFGISGLIIALWKEKNMPPFLQKNILLAINGLFPVAMSIGKILGIDRQMFQSSFIEVNNHLVKSKNLKVSPKKILLLAPHCLQKNDCTHKITVDPNNCIRCGRCQVDDLHSLAEKYGVKILIVTGGTLARKFIEELAPKAIIAIACERDLTSGIMDSKPLPVLGVLNIRPEGPCFNTRVNMTAVEDAIQFFLRNSSKEIA